MNNFFKLNGKGLYYLLDNRNGKIVECAHEILILDLSYLKNEPEELINKSELELFTISQNDIGLHSLFDIMRGAYN